MDDKGIRRIATRIYRGWLWYDGQLLLEHVDRVADRACVISRTDQTTIRWAAWLSAAPTVGIREAELLRLGVPRAVVSLVEWLRYRPDELPIRYVERISARYAATVIAFAELSERAAAAPDRYWHWWRDAHQLLGAKLGLPLPPEVPSAETLEVEPPIAPTDPAEHWDEFAEQVKAQKDSPALDQLLAAYATETRQCCRTAIRGAIYTVGRGPNTSDLADRWWDSTDPWEAMIATRATRDTDRLRSRFDDDRPGVVAAALEGLPPESAEPAEVAALGRVLQRSDPFWRWARAKAAQRLRTIGGPDAEAALRDRFLSHLDPPWREDPQWLTAYGAAHITELIANLDVSGWWFEAPYALGKLRAIEAVPAICRRLRAHPTWQPGIDALGSIGSADAVETLIETAVTGSAEARDHSLRALTRISPTSAVAAALVAADDLEPTVRDRAARILVQHGDERAFTALLRLCDTRFAARAAQALGRIGDPRAEPTLCALFLAGAPHVRSAAGRALAGMSGPYRFAQYLAWNGGPGLRLAYIRLLGNRHDWALHNLIERAAEDFDPKVRSATAHLIATRADQTQRAVLDQLLDDPDPRVRKAAAIAIQRLAAAPQPKQ